LGVEGKVKGRTSLTIAKETIAVAMESYRKLF